MTLTPSRSKSPLRWEAAPVSTATRADLSARPSRSDRPVGSPWPSPIRTRPDWRPVAGPPVASSGKPMRSLDPRSRCYGPTRWARSMRLTSPPMTARADSWAWMPSPVQPTSPTPSGIRQTQDPRQQRPMARSPVARPWPRPPSIHPVAGPSPIPYPLARRGSAAW